MQNGSIAAEADDQVCIGQFPVQTAETDVLGQLVGTVHLKGQTDFWLKTGIFQNPDSFPNRLKIFIPVGIGGQHDIFHGYTPLSSAAWACSTTSAVSGRMPGLSSRVR